MTFSTQKTLTGVIVLIFLVAFTVSSCSKFDGDQTVPSYIKIDSIGLKITDYSQGSKSVNISDAWIYVDDVLVGAFELPCVIPALHEGKCKVVVKPGIRLNDFINLRSAFPLYTDYTTTVTLTPDSITTLGSTISSSTKKTIFVEYNSNTTIEFNEAFEDASLLFDTTSKSQVAMGLTPAGSPLTFEGDHSGVVTLSDSITYFEMYTNERIFLPGEGTAVFLEMNYKTSVPVTIGVYSYTTSTVVQHPVLVLTEMPTWRKIYVNLTPIVSSQTDAINFRVFIGASRLESDPAGTLYLDNVKLIHL